MLGGIFGQLQSHIHCEVTDLAGKFHPLQLKGYHQEGESQEQQDPTFRSG